jgi:hypothetical protein
MKSMWKIWVSNSIRQNFLGMSEILIYMGPNMIGYPLFNIKDSFLELSNSPFSSLFL